MANDTQVLQQLNVPLTELKANPDQPRKFFDPEALAGLTESIRQYGILQPIIYCLDKDGQKIIVAGERRYQAAKNAGLTEIPAICIDEKQSDKIAMVENLLRQDLTSIEEAEGLMHLKEKYRYTNSALGAMFGKAKNTIGDILCINDLPEEIKEDCRNKMGVSKTKLSLIARMRDKDRQFRTYERLVRCKLTREEIRNEQTAGKEQFKLVMSFAKSLKAKLNDAEFVVGDAKEKENIRAELSTLAEDINRFLGKI